MKKVKVINAKIAQIGEDFSTLCVLDGKQNVVQYAETLAEQIYNFCIDNDVKVTKKQVGRIAMELSWGDYAETPEGELLFTAATYEIL